MTTPLSASHVKTVLENIRAPKRSKILVLTSVLVLLDTLNINGALISVDAMNTQKKIADKIISRGADYVLCVKNNHSVLRNEIAAYFTKVSRDNPEFLAEFEETDAEHGRTEARRYRQPRVSEWITESAHWRLLQTIIEVERERYTSKAEHPSHEKQYYIRLLPPDVGRIAGAIRSHWEVEAKAHWVLGVTFKEDDSRIRAGKGAENMAVIRRFALNLARLHPQKDSMRSKLKQAGWSDKFRSEILWLKLNQSVRLPYLVTDNTSA